MKMGWNLKTEREMEDLTTKNSMRGKKVKVHVEKKMRTKMKVELDLQAQIDLVDIIVLSSSKIMKRYMKIGWTSGESQ